MAPIVYEPLTQDEFRLLTLLPGLEEPIQCKLRTARLGEVSFHQEGIYLWNEKEAIEMKNKPSFSHSTLHPARLLHRGRQKLDPVFTMGLKVVRGRSADPEEITVTVTKGSDQVHQTHVGGGFFLAIHKGPAPSGCEDATEWTRDQIPIVPEYEALSYAWGDATPTKVVTINGCAVEVRQNLHTALLQLRSKSKARDLWVDALCIDQQSLEERSTQVIRMPSIYQRASHVIAWLGPATATSPAAFQLLQQLGRHEDPKKLHWYEYYEWLGPQFELWRGHRGDGPKREWYELPEASQSGRRDPLRGNYSQKIDPCGQRALHDLLTMPYWKRVWIIQELAYARSITLVCGSMSLDWSSFQVAITEDYCDLFPETEDKIHWFCEFLQDSGISFLQNNRSRTRLPYRAHGFELRSATLLRTLESAWDFQSTDPRDKIYALLGLPALDDDMVLPPPDYSRSVSHVFCTAAKAMIRYERALSILCLHHSGEEPRPLGLPSWMPNWTARSKECPLLMEVFPSRPKFCAAGLTSVEGSDWEVSEDGRRIDDWAHSLGAGPITQKSLFQMKYLKKQRKAPVEAVPNTREERAEEYNDGAWQLRGSKAFGSKDGLTTRRYSVASSPELIDPYKLVVDGFEVSRVVSDHRAVTPEDVASDEWTNIIREWELVDEKYLFTADDACGQFPPHAYFLWIIVKGHFGRLSDEYEQNWLTLFYEKYLVWAGRLDINSATYRRGHHLVDEIKPALKRTVGWKFAISDKGHLAMVPARTCAGDSICVLFGADVPMILRQRPQSTSEMSYEFIGPAYVHNIMYGEAMKEFTQGNYPRSTFTMT